MTTDSRGIPVRRDDLVVWWGKVDGQRAVHLGVVEGTGFLFSGRVRVCLARLGLDGDIRTLGLTASVPSDHLMVIEDVPESPYE